MSAKLIVYLDAQDFSHIARPPSGKEVFYSDLDNDLSSLVAAGHIEVRYSAVHLSEIAHTGMDFAPLSSGRAATLKRLSKGKCMRFWTDLMQSEIEHHFDATTTISATSEDDKWFDVESVELADFLGGLRSSMHSLLKEQGQNRKARRKAMAQIDLISFLTKTDKGGVVLEGIATNINEKFPLDVELDRFAIADFIAGRAGAHKFEEYLRGALTDPVSLIARMCVDVDQSLRLPFLVRNLGASLIGKLNPIVEKIAEFFEQIEGPADLRKNQARSLIAGATVKARRGVIAGTLAGMRRSVVRAAARYTDDDLDAMALPATDSVAGGFGKCLSDIISAAEAGKPTRRFRQSDAADLLHATYIPYVDVFRCDTAWADAFRSMGLRFNTDIVGRIEDLLPAIHRRIAAG